MALTFIIAQAVIANAAKIEVWTARAFATVLAEIGPRFEQETGHTLKVSSGLPPEFSRRANAGEPFDVLISGSSPVDQWIEDGRIVATTRTRMARSGIGVGVRAGAPKPDISSVEAFKRALLHAKSIAYLRVGSGISRTCVIVSELQMPSSRKSPGRNPILFPSLSPRERSSSALSSSLRF